MIPSREIWILAALTFIGNLSFLHSQAIEDELVFAFRGHNRIESERMVVVGEVVSIEKAQTLESVPLTDLNLDTRPDNVVVKVLNPKGIRIGQTLYLVEKDPDHRKFRNGNIVGEIIVKSIFDTTFFGKQLRGEGYTRMIEDRPVTVVRLQESADTKEALVLKIKGDAFYHRNEIPEAMRYYRKAVGLDAKLADAHYALGRAYISEPYGKISILSEFEMAWKHRENFSGIRERVKFYNDYMKFIVDNWEEDKRKIQSLNRMQEVISDYRRIIGFHFETELYESWMNYHKFILEKGNPEKESLYLEKSKENLNRARKFSRESILFHEMAILLANEDLENWTLGRPITDKVEEAIRTIRFHGRRLLLINPPGNPISTKVIEILERVPG